MVQDERRGHRNPRGLAEAVGELDRGQRIESQLGERTVGIGLIGGVAEDGRRRRAHVGEHDLVPLRPRGLDQASADRARRPTVLGACGPGAVRFATQTSRRAIRDPVPTALKRIRREIDGLGAARVEERPPVDGHTAGVQGRQCEKRGSRRWAPWAYQRHRIDVRRKKALTSHRREHRAWTDLDERADAVIAQGGDGVVKADRLADVTRPVVGIATLLGSNHPPSQRGHERDGGRGEGDGPQNAAELVQHRFHQRRVEGVADGKLPCPGTTARELGGNGRDQRHGPRQHHRGRPVHRGDADPTVRWQRRAGLVLVDRDSDHRTAGGKRAHELATRGDHPGRIVE